MIFGGPRAISCILGVSRKQILWAATYYIHTCIYKLTRSTGHMILQTYKTYRTYKPITSHSKAPQPVALIYAYSQRLASKYPSRPVQE